MLTEGIALKWRVSKQVFISATLYKVDESGKLGLYHENLPQAGEVIDKEVRQGNKNAYMLVVLSERQSSHQHKKGGATMRKVCTSTVIPYSRTEPTLCTI